MSDLRPGTPPPERSSDSLLPRLFLWTGFGFFFAFASFICGLSGDWIGFIPSLVATCLSIFMLGTGLWMRWPRG